MDTWNNLFASHQNAWVAKVFLVILVTASLSLLAHYVIARLKEKVITRTRTVWDDAAVAAAEQPAHVLIWVVGLDVAASVIQRVSKNELFDYAHTARELLVILIIAWFLLRLVREVEQRITTGNNGEAALDITSATAIAKLLRVTVIITAALTLMEKLGYSISGILAFGGIGGIAVGFAAKDLLANFFGGLMIFMDRPFSIGDWVRSPDRDIEGTVEHIGWRLTRIRTFDKRPLYIPNATFTSIAVENPSRMSHRRIYENIGVRYDDWQKVPAIVADVKKMLNEHEGIAQDQTMIINFNQFNESSLDFMVYAFTRTCAWVEFHEVKQDVLYRIMQIIDSHGAEVAFPTRTLHVAPMGDAERLQR